MASLTSSHRGGAARAHLPASDDAPAAWPDLTELLADP